MKPTKKNIVSTLRTLDTTAIHKIAFKAGVNTSDKGEMFKFVQQYAPSNKVYNKAYNLTYGRSKDIPNIDKSRDHLKIASAIQRAKWHKQETVGTSYHKILIEGNTNIYWASPVYGHSDYNKSIAFPLTNKNIKVMNLINNYLS